MWPLFKQTVRNNRVSWLIYSLVGLIFLVLYVPIFPSIQQQQDTLNKVYSSLPKGILEAFNITQTSATLMGFLTSKHFAFVWILMVIFLMLSFAGGAIAKEVDKLTMGLLLSLPISRLRIYITRLIAGVFGLVVFIALTELITWPIAKIFNYACPWIDVFNVGLLGFLFGLAVLGIAMMFSALTSDSGKVYGLAGGLLLVMYVINIASQLKDQLDKLKYVSIFHYYIPGDVIDGGHLDHTSLLVLGGTAIVSTVIGAIIFTRRDVSV
jgi:ABC-2 type transport system permease protein